MSFWEFCSAWIHFTHTVQTTELCNIQILTREEESQHGGIFGVASGTMTIHHSIRWLLFTPCSSEFLDFALVLSSILHAGTYHYLGNFRVPKSSLSQTVCCSPFVRSFSTCVHLGYICPWLFQLTETICVDTNRFQSTGEKAGTYLAPLVDSVFLQQDLVWLGS